MLAQRRMYDTAIEEDFGSVGDLVKGGQRIVEFVVVVEVKRLDPRFDFLSSPVVSLDSLEISLKIGVARTCFRDIVRARTSVRSAVFLRNARLARLASLILSKPDQWRCQ